MSTIDEILGKTNRKKLTSVATTQPQVATEVVQQYQVQPETAELIERTNPMGQQFPAKDNAMVAKLSQNIETPKLSSTTTDDSANNTTETTKSHPYDPLFKQLEIGREKTEAEKERKKKKYERDQLFNSISDGLSALSNMYFTTKYAPNMYRADNSLAKTRKKRWERFLDKNDKDMQNYYRNLYALQKLKDDYDYDIWMQNFKTGEADRDQKNTEAELEVKKEGNEIRKKTNEINEKRVNQKNESPKEPKGTKTSGRGGSSQIKLSTGGNGYLTVERDWWNRTWGKLGFETQKQAETALANGDKEAVAILKQLIDESKRPHKKKSLYSSAESQKKDKDTLFS